MIVKELITKLGFNVDQNAIGKAERGMMSLRRLAIGVSSVFAGISVYHFFKGIVDAADELKDASNMIGITSDALQKLQYSAKISGVSVEGLRTGMFRFSRVLEQARTGSKEAAASLRKVGIGDAKKFKTIEEALYAVAEGARTVKNDMKLAAIMQELFGRGGVPMANMLKQGSKELIKQGELLLAVGGIMDKELIAKADEFKDSMVLIRLAMRGLGAMIMASLLPHMNKLTDALINWLKSNKEAIRLKIDEWVTKAGKAFEFLGKMLGGVKDDGQIDYLTALDRVLKGLVATLGLLAAGRLVGALYSIGKGLGWVLGLMGIGGAGAGVAEGGAAVAGGAAAAGLGVVGTIAAVVAAIAAAVAGLYLVYDDLKAFFAGQGSVFELSFRQLLRSIFWFKDQMIYVWNNLPDILLSIFKNIPHILYMAFVYPIEWSVKKVWELIQWLYDKMSYLNPMRFFENPNVQRIWNEEKERANKNATGVLTRQPATSAGARNAAVQNNKNFTVTSSVQVNVETGADPEKIGKVVGQRVDEVWDEKLRQAQRHGATGGW